MCHCRKGMTCLIKHNDEIKKVKAEEAKRKNQPNSNSLSCTQIDCQDTAQPHVESN